ncbi:MAG: ABC transporter ATP-binding protein [Candidatus Dojkabacteria bacterium]
MDQILQILKFTKSFWKYYVFISFFIIAVALLNLVTPILSGNIVDAIVNNIKNGTGDFNYIAVILAIMISSDIVITIFANISGYYGDILGQKLNTFLTSKFYEHVLDLQVEYFDNEVSGKIISKLERGIGNIAEFINNMLNNFVPFFLTAIFTIVALAFYSIEISVLLLILFPIYVIISEKSSNAWIKKQGEINKVQDSLQGRIFESITSIRVVKSFLRQDLEHSKYHDFRKDVEIRAKAQSKEWHLFDVFRGAMLNIILFGIYAYIVYFTFTGRFTIGQMTLLLGLVNQAKFPLRAMSFILGQIQRAQAGSKDFFDVLNEPVVIKDKVDAKDLQKVGGELKFNNVSFAYKDGKDILSGINFNIDKGKKLAIVGESGEGKSTITNLILRFYEPKSGEILVDNSNIQDVTQKSLHKNISVVLQDSILFSGTIEENIRYGREGATNEEIIEAAKKANADSFISKFEKGYDTQIGERGVKLSGGQKQRLSIARAILKNAPILILDEATSSLDSKAEAEVQKALNELMEGKTTIIIAHRLSTIRNVDKIIVLKSGVIAEMGSPSDLIKKNGIYAELVKLQTNINQGEPSAAMKEFKLVG